METKKILTISFSMLAICVLAFVGIWLGINWANVKNGLSGTELYTLADLEKAKEEGYNEALVNTDSLNEQLDDYKSSVEQYQSLIRELQASNNELNTQNNQYKGANSELTNTVNQLENSISYIREELNTKENEIDYYQSILAELETDNTAYVTFKANGVVYKITPVEKGNTVDEVAPTLEYHNFDSWTYGGNAITMPYTITETTILEATYTHQTVNFMAKSDFKQILSQNSSQINNIVFDYYSYNDDVYFVDDSNILYNKSAIATASDDKIKLYLIDGTLYCLSHYEMCLPADCSSLFVVSNGNISDLNSIIFNNINTSNVTTMNSMFSWCGNLLTLDLSSFNTSNVTNMSSMFNKCIRLTSLDLSSFNTSNVTTMSAMFNDCRHLISLDLSNFNTSNVTTMNSMFGLCKDLTTLNINSFNTSAIKDMEAMFMGCENLTSLDLSSFNTSTAIYMDQMFRDCKKLRTIDLSSFDFACVYHLSHMFQNCSTLTTIYVSNVDLNRAIAQNQLYSSQTYGIFEGCVNLVGGNGTHYNGSVYEQSIYYDDLSLAQIDSAQNPGYFTYKAIN